MNEVRSGTGNLIIDLPGTGQLAGAARLCRLQREERDDVARVSVKDLSVCCVCWTANNLIRVRATQIFDMCEDNVGGFALELVVLATSLGSDMG